MNVGASSPTDYGNYYKYGLGAEQFDKTQANYTGTENPLAASADTAVQVWGGQWHMPTETQFEELFNECTWTWTTSGGTNGYKVVKGNNSIFLPVTGYWSNDSKYDAESKGYYWCSTPRGSNNAHNLTFSNESKSQGISLRSYGFTIRPVMN